MLLIVTEWIEEKKNVVKTAVWAILLWWVNAPIKQDLIISGFAVFPTSSTCEFRTNLDQHVNMSMKVFQTSFTRSHFCSLMLKLTSSPATGRASGLLVGWFDDLSAHFKLGKSVWPFFSYQSVWLVLRNALVKKTCKSGAGVHVFEDLLWRKRDDGSTVRWRKSRMNIWL